MPSENDRAPKKFSKRAFNVLGKNSTPLMAWPWKISKRAFNIAGNIQGALQNFRAPSKNSKHAFNLQAIFEGVHKPCPIYITRGPIKGDANFKACPKKIASVLVILQAMVEAPLRGAQHIFPSAPPILRGICYESSKHCMESEGQPPALWRAVLPLTKFIES